MVNGVAGGGRGEEGGDAAGFKSCAQVFPPGMFDGGRGGKATLPAGWENLSGMFGFLFQPFCKSLRNLVVEYII